MKKIILLFVMIPALCFAQGEDADILLNGTVSALNNQIKDVNDPTEAQDAVNLGFLMNKLSELQDQIDLLLPLIGSGTVMDQDGNSYLYLPYGNQIWTVQNAAVITYRDGTPIPQVQIIDQTEWSELTTGAWSYYDDNDPSKGIIYNWYAVAGIHDTDPNTPNKELAPEGWHVPSDQEWLELESYLITNGYNYDGSTSGNNLPKAMASKYGWNTSTVFGEPGNDQHLNNSSGFNAKPVGTRYGYQSGSSAGAGTFAIFWTITPSFADYSWFYAIGNESTSTHLYGGNSRTDGMSVRFVKD